MQIANGLSVDVEDYFHAEAITGQIGRHNSMGVGNSGGDGIPIRFEHFPNPP